MSAVLPAAADLMAIDICGLVLIATANGCRSCASRGLGWIPAIGIQSISILSTGKRLTILTIELSPLLHLHFGSIEDHAVLSVLSELSFLKPVSYVIFLCSVLLTMHHNDFIPNSTELDGVSNV